ncbi:hypothetical protein KSS87_018975 [Heliosperma pusillum]|nr:hypothetical protein KSS87_018975 [Heliosperma pusillum]
MPNNSVDTVNAAAAAIVTAESRVQPSSSQKRRWASFWNLYWCFGSVKTSKRIGHAALVPEPDVIEGTVPIADNPNPTTSTVLPFIAPPSSPLPQSDPPTGTHSPVGSLALTPLSVNGFSSFKEAHIFTVGPYANESQLVSPPVFSAYPTEPSTAAITPPPEPVHFTTPSSPEVPFAQLLTSSLNRDWRNSGTHQKFALSCYEVHHLISPGSANSASGTSSPYLDRRPVLEFRMIDASKLFDSKNMYTCKWGSRVDSGSVTPHGPMENQICETTSHANLQTGSLIDETLAAQRVSFELSREDVPKLLEKRNEEILEKQQETLEKNPGEMEYWQHTRSSFSLGSVKEFNFDSSQETPVKLNSGSQWWADETIVRDIEAEDDWSFFPLLQTGVS